MSSAATIGSICSHETVGCFSTRGASRATVGAINSYDLTSCLFTIGITPDANINQWQNTDIAFTVWTTKGERTLDNATVEFVIRSGSGTTIPTKSTDDYSVITFGNTLVVHLNENELPANKTAYYTATITTSDELEYSMTGLIHVSGTAVDTCFMTDVSISERSITVIPTMQRGELNEIPERSVSTILCTRTSIPITTSERTSEIIVIAPCGKRRGV